MSSFNKITVVGYLGRAPELRYTPDGTPVSNFSVATTERRKDKSGELQETTTWFHVALFGGRAEVANEYLSKGSHVWLEGPLTLNQWTDREGAASSTWKSEPLTSNSCLPQPRKPQPQPPQRK